MHRPVISIFPLNFHVSVSVTTLPLFTKWWAGTDKARGTSVSSAPIVFLTNSLRLNAEWTWLDFPGVVIFPHSPEKTMAAEAQGHDTWHTFRDSLIAQGHTAWPGINADWTKHCTFWAACQNVLFLKKARICRNLQSRLPLTLPKRTPVTRRLAGNSIS